ncbi:unnamed protein product, partial [Amoebophrya sp. A25]
LWRGDDAVHPEVGRNINLSDGKDLSSVQKTSRNRAIDQEEELQDLHAEALVTVGSYSSYDHQTYDTRASSSSAAALTPCLVSRKCEGRTNSTTSSEQQYKKNNHNVDIVKILSSSRSSDTLQTSTTSSHVKNHDNDLRQAPSYQARQATHAGGSRRRSFVFVSA